MGQVSPLSFMVLLSGKRIGLERGELTINRLDKILPSEGRLELLSILRRFRTCAGVPISSFIGWPSGVIMKWSYQKVLIQ